MERLKKAQYVRHVMCARGAVARGTPRGSRIADERCPWRCLWLLTSCGLVPLCVVAGAAMARGPPPDLDCSAPEIRG